jgi:hypothetical protein
VVSPEDQRGQRPNFGTFTVAWDHVFLNANPLILAYLDDIKLSDELVLMRPFARLLAKRGPAFGLIFTKRAKNYFYAPLPFLRQVTDLYPDAVVVTEESPGQNPSDQLKQAAEVNSLSAPENLSRLLFTTCGVEKLMGSPLRLVEREERPAEVSKAWLRSQVTSLTGSTAALFAHLGIAEVDDTAGVLEFQSYPDPDELIPRLPKAEPQIQNFVARHTLARRLNHITRVLPPSITQGPLANVEMLLKATVAGLMRVKLSDLTLAQQRRLTLPARWSGSMPGGVLAAPAQFLSASVKAEERALEVMRKMRNSQMSIPLTLRTIAARREARKQEGAQLSFTERGLQACMGYINEARANPGFAHESLVRSRGEGVNGRVRPDEEREEARRARQVLDVPRRGGGEVQVNASEGAAPPTREEEGDDNVALSFTNIVTSNTSARLLSESIFKRAAGCIIADMPVKEATAMSAGMGKCAASFLSAVPSTEAFTIEEGTFVRSLQRYNAIPPVRTPHTHHCGHRGTRRLTDGNVGHLFHCPCLGGNIHPHDAVKDTLAHAIHNCGLCAVVPSTEVATPIPGGTWNADILFMDEISQTEFIIDVNIVNVDSVTSQRRRRDFGAVEAALRDGEREKRNLPVARQIQNDGSNKIFVPFVMSSAGGFGPAARGFLKLLYKSARERNRWEMSSGQPQVESTWNTLFASTHWDMRLSMACTAMSAEVVGRVIVRDFNLNMSRDESRQPWSNPNTPAYGRRRRVGSRPAV